jgi:hypothetical protein
MQRAMTFIEGDQELKDKILINAHKDCMNSLILDISIIKLSPNGLRVVTASIKGTIITNLGTIVRSFSSTNG